MTEVKITGGIAVIDDEDAPRIMEHFWHTNHDGYAMTNIMHNGKRRSTSMHRMIMGCTIGDGKELDHINGNRLDNRKENLRFVSHQCNTWNTRGKRNDGTSYKGITSNGYTGFDASIRVNGKPLFLGACKTEAEAAKLYDIAASIYYKEYARLNFPENPPTEQEKEDLLKRLNSPLISTNTSGYMGVSYHSTRKWWVGSIIVNKKTYKLTPCKTALEAAIARDKKAYELLGDRAKLNFPERVEEYKANA